jgi:hypothetical protein
LLPLLFFSSKKPSGAAQLPRNLIGVEGDLVCGSKSQTVVSVAVINQSTEDDYLSADPKVNPFLGM